MKFFISPLSAKAIYFSQDEKSMAYHTFGPDQYVGSKLKTLEITVGMASVIL